jgi:formylglycine-generating enzyme required for sulfatase activity
MMLHRATTAVIGAMLVALATHCASDVGAIRPQWTVLLRTDAPVPNIADRLLVEVTNAQGALACTACRRILDVSAPEAWPVSFGVAYAESPLSIRARMYLARDTAANGEPPEAIGIDVRARLPAAPGPAIIELGTACFGVGSTLDATCTPSTKTLVATPLAATVEAAIPLQVGSYGVVAPCPAITSDAGKICIPGGLFLLREAGSQTTELQRKRAQLVQLSSFEMDRDEFTVGRFRAIALRNPTLTAPRSKSNDQTLNSICTYQGISDDSVDAMPVNCITREQARSYCAAEEARLVRDAEFAYVAGNGALGSTFPWGSATDICNRAVVGRGPVAVELDTRDGSFECRIVRPDLRLGPVAAVFAGAEGDSALGVRGLAGNVSEWTDDDFAVITEPCWRGLPLLSNPLCRTEAHLPGWRGGSWQSPAYSADARYRASALSGDAPPSIGFRCARTLP